MKHLSSVLPPEVCELNFALRRNDGLRVFNEIAQSRKIKIWEYDWRHLDPIKSFFIGIKLFRKIKPTIIIFNSSEDKILPIIWASILSKIPKRIMIVHWAQESDAMPFFRRRTFMLLPIPSRYAIKTRLIRSISYNSMQRLIFVNNITREVYQILYKIPKVKCVTIYNGIDVNSIKRSRKKKYEIREQLKLSNKDIIVSASGNLTRVKGHEYLIKAISILRNKGLRIKCFIAGEGELKSELNILINKMDLNGIIELLGYREDVPFLLSASDIFCMPSLNEALGYSILEALAAGVPVVASAVGGIPEVITDGEEGLLVKPADTESLANSIEKLSLDIKLRERFAKQGEKKVREKFSLERMRRQTSELFWDELEILERCK